MNETPLRLTMEYLSLRVAISVRATEYDGDIDKDMAVGAAFLRAQMRHPDKTLELWGFERKRHDHVIVTFEVI